MIIIVLVVRKNSALQSEQRAHKSNYADDIEAHLLNESYLVLRIYPVWDCIRLSWIGGRTKEDFWEFAKYLDFFLFTAIEVVW